MITKLTFGVINKDRELLGFAFLSFLFSVIFSVAMIVPSIVPTVMDNGLSTESLEIYQYVIIFLTYFGLAFIATFFNACVVYTTKVRFEGGNATFGESVRFAMSRIGIIVQWSLISASVGLLLRILHDLASRLGKIGEIVANIVIGLLGMAWSVLTIFVVPVLVYEGLGPIDAIKKSAEVIKKTWGENIIRAIGLGLVQLLVFAVIIAFAFALSYGLGMVFSVYGVAIGVCLGLVLLLLAGLIFMVANTIFNTVLYVYANQNSIPEGFTEPVVREAFKQK
jgi:ABC-type multidrug transport system fused ATPase/permease subunit